MTEKGIWQSQNENREQVTKNKKDWKTWGTTTGGTWDAQ